MPAWLAPAACVLVAIGMRLIAWREQPYITVDGTEYVRFAEALARGDGYRSIFPPGYPLLIVPMFALGDRALAPALVSFVCGVLLPLPTWWLARAAVGAAWAWAPALLVALHPELARFSVLAMSESAYFLALWLAVAVVAAGRAFRGGLLTGAAFAIRPEALVPGAALALRETWHAWHGRAGWRGPLRFAAGFVLMALPCWLWFHATLGEWTLTPKAGAFRAPAASWQEEERRLRSDSLRAATTPGAGEGTPGAGESLRYYPQNALRHGESLLMQWPWPLLLLSLWGLARRRGIESLPLVYLVALPVLGLSQQPRFVMSALPALAILAVVPLALERARVARIAAAAIGVLGLAALAFAHSDTFRQPFEGDIWVHRRAGEWLSGVAEPNAVVMDRKPYVAFYAGAGYHVMPDDPYDALLDGAVRSGVRSLVLDQALAEIMRPQLLPLLYDPARLAAEPRVELIYVGGREVGRGLGIFRVLKPNEAKRNQPPVVEARYLQSP